VSAWIKSSSFPVNDAAIVSKLTEPPQGFQLDTTVDTGPRTIAFKLSNVAGYMVRYGASVLQLGQWYHVAGVYDAGARTLNVYLNGQLDNGNLFGTVRSSQRDSPLAVTIGQRPDCFSCYAFSGTIDEVRIYNRALTQGEVQTDMATPASTPPGDTTPPTAPSGLGATAVSASQINLAWTASTDNLGVTGYRVERCQGAGCANFAQIAAPTATSFNDTGLSAAASYSYRVRAADAAGNLSAYSNVASATTVNPQGAQLYYIHPDHLNTPRLIANSTGTTVWRWDQGEPFGNDVPNTNPSGAGAFDFPLRFPGQYFDRETNLAYNWFRDYDFGIGRYIQSDPIGVRGAARRYGIADTRLLYALPTDLLETDPETIELIRRSTASQLSYPGDFNLYAYVKGNPLRWVDPKGLDTFPPSGGRGAGGGTCKVMIDIPITPVGDADHNWLFFCVWICRTGSCPPKIWFRSAVVTVLLYQGCPDSPP
jgi:RHS repeat-associated protein